MDPNFTILIDRAVNITKQNKSFLKKHSYAFIGQISDTVSPDQCVNVCVFCAEAIRKTALRNGLSSVMLTSSKYLEAREVSSARKKLEFIAAVILCCAIVVFRLIIDFFFPERLTGVIGVKMPCVA